MIVQTYAAMLHLFAESPAGPPNARAHLQRARDSAVPATPREQMMGAAIQAWADGDLPLALRLHAQLLAEHPRDLVSVKLAQYHLFNLGDARGMLQAVLPARDACAEVSWVHGMTAFGHEQCHELELAEASARRALSLRRKEPWAQHALAHVMLTQHRNSEGRAFMASMSDTWVGLNSFMVTHNWWHLALFLIELGELHEALSLYDTRVWGVVKEYSQDQVNAVSLLARLELAGKDVGDRWEDVADHLVGRTHEHVQPFLDMHYLYGLARAHRPEADTLLASIRTHCASCPALVRQAWQEVCLPACEGLLAHARGDHLRCAERLGAVLPRLAQIGGSHAQRDLFERIHADAVRHSR